MNIALVIDRFLPQKGGGERYVDLLARGLARRGHEVTIFARAFPDTRPPAPSIHYRRLDVPSRPAFLRVWLFASRCEKETKHHNRFDIIHDVGHMIGADVFNPHGGVEQVWLSRYFASYDNPLHRALKRAQRFLSLKERAFLSLQRRQYLSPQTRRILAISPMIQEHIRAYYPEIPMKKIALILDPAELTRFTPKNRERFREGERKRLRLHCNEIVLLFVGNNFRLKGLRPLLKSLTVLGQLNKKGRPFHLLVVGNEAARRWKRQAAKEGVEKLVTFLGNVREMERLYAAADIFVLPTFYDSAGLVVLEALASGLPVITSQWCGNAHLIDTPATGMILDDNDNPTEIAQAMHVYFPDKARERALETAPKRVTSIGLEGHIDLVLALYTKVMKEKSHG